MGERERGEEREKVFEPFEIVSPVSFDFLFFNSTLATRKRSSMVPSSSTLTRRHPSLQRTLNNIIQKKKRKKRKKKKKEKERNCHSKKNE